MRAACALKTQSGFVMDAVDLHVDRLGECFALDEHAPALEPRQRSSRYPGSGGGRPERVLLL
jgi:hypothetical protein